MTKIRSYRQTGAAERPGGRAVLAARMSSIAPRLRPLTEPAGHGANRVERPVQIELLERHRMDDGAEFGVQLPPQLREPVLRDIHGAGALHGQLDPHQINDVRGDRVEAPLLDCVIDVEEVANGRL